MNSFFARGRRCTGALVAAGAITLAGCSSVTDSLLDVTDPDIINPTDVRSPDGADALRIGALSRLTTLTAAAPANAEGVW